MNKLTFKKFFDSKIRNNLFKKFLPVIIIFFVFLGVSLGIITFSVKSSIEENNRIIINFITKSLNSSFKTIDEIYKTYEIYGQNDNIFLEGSYAEEISNKINNNILQVNFLNEIVIISNTGNYVISSSGLLDKQDFFTKRYNSDIYTKTFFDNVTTDNINVKVLPATTYKNLIKYPVEDPERMLVFIHTYEKSNIKILMFISESKFIKTTNIDSLDNINLKIYDNNDSVIYSSSGDDFFLDTGNISKNFNHLTVNKLFKTYYISKSDYNFFYYVSETKNIINIIILFGLAFILLGLLTALFYFVVKVREISKDISAIYESADLDEEFTEIKDVPGKINKLVARIKEDDEKIDALSNEIKSGIFIKMINSSSFYTHNKKIVESVFKNLLDKNELIIISVELLKANEKLNNYQNDMLEKLFSKWKSSFVNIEENPFKDLYVVGFSETVNIKSIIDELNTCVDDIRNNNISLLVNVSNPFKDIGNIYIAYREIKVCRNYRGINDKKTILTLEGISGRNSYLPVNFREELTGRIISKDRASIRNYIKEIFETNIKNNVPVSKFEFMLRQMINIVTDILSSNKKEEVDIYELEQMFLTVIDGLYNNFEVYSVLNSIINIINMGISMDDSKKGTLNKGDIIKYINLHYKDDIYLAKIASVFFTTPKYFSNYFKKEFLVGFNEYLTQVRISHAKELLVKTDLPLSLISQNVGYVNQATFAAAFKKNLKMPPGKYREMNKI